MVGRCISYRSSPFLRDMLVFRGVHVSPCPETGGMFKFQPFVFGGCSSIWKIHSWWWRLGIGEFKTGACFVSVIIGDSPKDSLVMHDYKIKYHEFFVDFPGYCLAGQEAAVAMGQAIFEAISCHWWTRGEVNMDEASKKDTISFISWNTLQGTN